MSAEFMLPENGSWVGPPAIYLKLRLGGERHLLDGKRRLKEHKRRGLRTSIPELEVHSHRQAIVSLIHNRHYDRAALHAITYAPELATTSASAITYLTDFNAAQIQPYIKALKDPAQRHKLPRRAMDVVVRGRSLYQRALEGDPIEINDIAKVLGAFLDD